MEASVDLLGIRIEAASKLLSMLDQTWSTFSVVLKAFLCLQQNVELFASFRLVLHASCAILCVKFIKLIHLVDNTSKRSFQILKFKCEHLLTL